MIKGKYPYQDVYTDEEANLRTIEDPSNFKKCLFCKFLDDSKGTKNSKCSKGHNGTNCQTQICDE